MAPDKNFNNEMDVVDSCYHYDMKRTLIQFDEGTYDKLRHRAFQEKRSISSVVREMVTAGLDSRTKKRFTRVEQLTSVGAGSSDQGRLAPVSERHDEALAEVLHTQIRRTASPLRRQKKK